jgi:histidinol-phosphatase (PHP family)
MPWVNYHSHSLFCDGKAIPEDFIRPAIEQGFPAYGYSSHAPVPFVSKWNMSAEKLQDYLREISRIKTEFSGRIQVYTGLEIDFIEGLWGFRQTGLKKSALDYFIGSVHYIGQFPDGSHFCFDGQPEDFFRGIAIVYQNDFVKAITSYYHSVMRMTETDVPDVIGHMDKIKMHNSFMPYLNEEEKWYTDLVEETLEVIRQKGCIVEVNTRGLYKHNPPLLYPGKWILERLHQKKIPVMLNSDSHHPDEIKSGFTFAANLLVEIGFKTLRVLMDSRWQEKAFDENGLVF